MKHIPSCRLQSSHAPARFGFGIFALLASLLLPASLHAVSVKYTASGTFTPPAGVTNITVECWGGGGAGGSVTASAASGGSGGGGGAYAKKLNIPVTAGTPYTVAIPAAATALASGFTQNQQCAGGANITFTGDSSVSVTANGGTGGYCGVATTGTPSGVGGATNASPVYDLEWAGGNGARSPGQWGGGGGAASDLGIGSNAVLNVGGALKAGSNTDHDGGPGGTSGPGGTGNGPAPVSGIGGGGGARATTGTFRGGAGAKGQIIITYSTSVTKTNNTDNLNLGSSWVGGTAPDSVSTAIWDSTLQSPNGTIALGANLALGGITIMNPGVPVIISAGNTLTNSVYIDMSGAMADLTLNCDLALGAANIWDVTNSRTLSLGGVVSGSFSVTKQGGGTAILSAANTYTGGTTISAGTLQLGNGTSGNDGTIASPTIANSGALVYNRFGTNTYGGGINGSGSVTKTGSGKQILTGTNTYTGSTTISGGTLEIGGTGLLGNGTYANAITFASGANLKFSSSATNTLQTGVISGDGSITVDSAAGKIILAGANTYSGGVTLKNGTVESKTTSTTLGTGTVVMGGVGSSGATYITGQPNTNAFTINAPDSGTNIIGATGAGSGFVMTGPVTLNGNLTVQSYFSSVLQSATTRPTLNGGMTGTGNLILDNLSGGTNTITLGVNPINPAGSITAQGGSLGSNVISAVIGANVTGVTQNSATCPLILSATNAYTGNTTISAGTVRLTATGSINNSANLIVGTVPGTAAILDATAAGMTIGSSQTLKGHGTIGGTITVGAGGILAPGTSVGKLTFTNNLILNATSTNQFEFDVAGSTNDQVACVNLTPNGSIIALNITGGTLASGTYRLFDYSGAKTGNFGTPVITSGTAASGLRIVESVTNQINLLVNHLPVATNVNYTRASGLQLRIAITNLMSNVGDVDGDAVYFVDYTSTNAGILADANYIYVPSNSGAEQFTYRARDDYGGTNTGTVTININSNVFGQGKPNISTTGGNPTLTFAGIPGYSYSVQRADDLNFTVNVVTILTTNAPVGGVFQYTDQNNGPLPSPTAFYRLKYNP